MKSLLPFALLLWSAGFLCGGITQPSPAFAEEPAPNESAWRFRVAPYGWLTAVDGNVSIRGLEAPVDINIGDTLSTLEMAFMGYFEVGYQRWSLGLDVVYGKNSKSFSAGGRVFDSFRFELTQLLLTPSLAFRIIETPAFHMEILAGARIVSVSTELTARLARGGEIVRKRDTSWADPLVGIRGNWNITNDIFFRFNGDIGGFGVGSQLTWQAFGGIGYRFNELISAAVGYRGLGMDYAKGNFELNTVTHGPVLGLEFSW